MRAFAFPTAGGSDGTGTNRADGMAKVSGSQTCSNSWTSAAIRLKLPFTILALDV